MDKLDEYLNALKQSRPKKHKLSFYKEDVEELDRRFDDINDALDDNVHYIFEHMNKIEEKVDRLAALVKSLGLKDMDDLK